MSACVRFVGRLAPFLAVGAITLAPAPAAAQDPPAKPGRRVAVVVGANSPAPGRQALRYSHGDAQMLADTLVQVGRFAKTDVHVLLEPRPGEVLAALDAASRELASAPADSLLLFYYSGHSDGQQVYPHGETLALTQLRDRLARSSARVRIAVVDTCRGGSWTRAKGLTVGPALDPIDLMNVATEGTALLSSSSGMESAHEAGSIRGSFFTHHLNAGLLGAADASGDGNVTLQEAFVYARERTVRDSARMAATTQHPSFDMQLRGRQDIVLTQTKASKSALLVNQKNALEIIHLGSGATVVETPSSSGQLRIALPPGRYIVRRVEGARVLSKEIAISADATALLDEAQLEAAGERLALKDGEPDAPGRSGRSDEAESADSVDAAPIASDAPRAPGDPAAAKKDESDCPRDCCDECCSKRRDRKAQRKHASKWKMEDCDDDDDDPWEKTAIFGVRGAVTHTSGAETDGTFAAAMVQAATEQYKTSGLMSAHGTMHGALGGGSAGFEGALGGSIAGGLRAPVGESHGPIARIGIGGEMIGNKRFYFSRLALPTIEVGYQYLKDRTLFELGGRGSLILTGRYNTGHVTRRETGDGSIEWGGYASAHHKYGRLDVSFARIEAGDEFPGGAVNVGRGWLCGHILDKVAVCADAMVIRGDASYFVPGRAPPETPTGVTSVYGGITVGALNF